MVSPEKSSRDLYLDLIKKTLTFTLWPEPPAPIETFNFKNKALKRKIVSLVARLLNTRNLQLVEKRNIPTSRREIGLMWPVYADTMIGLKRLENIQYCIETVLSEGIEGDLIETGVWRGGGCIFMKAVLVAHEDQGRNIFVADSFEGLPKPDENKYPADKGNDFHTLAPYLAVSQETVKNNFKKYDLLDSRIIFLKGWFKDTLPTAPINKLCILRLDGDMYSSTIEVLESLYSKLSIGGFCIIDDYVLNECKAAVDDFRAQNNITSELIEIDWTGRYWRKEN